MLEKGNILTLSDNHEYSIVDLFQENGITYIYLVDINDHSNIFYGKLENDEVGIIHDAEELEKVIPLVNQHLHEK